MELWRHYRNGNTSNLVIPWRITHFEDVELASGGIAHGMWLQTSSALPYAFPYSNRNALYVTDVDLDPGTYCFNVHTSNKDTYTSYSFTTTKTIPAGGSISFYDASTFSLDSWSSDHKTLIENEITSTSGSTEGTLLGEINYYSRSDDGNCGCYCAAYAGDNNWATSTIRNWLNSNNDRRFDYLSENKWAVEYYSSRYMRGFLYELPDDFKNAMLTLKTRYYYYDFATSSANTYTSSSKKIGFSYDKVVLPTLNQMYINPANSTESSWDTPHEYWKRLNGTSQPWSWNTSYDDFTFGILNSSSTTTSNTNLRGYGSSPSSHPVIYNKKAANNYYNNSSYYTMPMVCIGKENV